MQITIQQLGKKYQSEWVFRGVSINIADGDRLAVLGRNGSGKTTLMKMISGAVMPTEGTLIHHHNGALVAVEKLYAELAYVAPYFELIEEFSLLEMVDFYNKFKPIRETLKSIDLLEQCGLWVHRSKKVSDCSSGMKQKLKLALGLFTDSSLLLLDEPLTNLDAESIAWFRNQMQTFARDRTLIVCSNHVEAEIFGCSKKLEI